MANTYTWNCRTVDTYPTQDSLSDVVYNVHWRYTGTDGTNSTTVIGTQTISTEDIDSESFVSFDNLTHDTIIGWVESAMGAERVAELQASLDSQLTELATPTSVTRTIAEEVTEEAE